MIRFLYDNDVLGHLIDRPDYPRVRSSVQQSIKDEENTFYYSEVNLWELFKGITSDNFPRLKTVLEEAYGLCGQGSVLVNPHEHLAYSAGVITHPQYLEGVGDLLGLIRGIIACVDYPSFVASFGALAKSTREQIDSLIKDARESTNLLKERLRGHALAKSKTARPGELSQYFFQLYCQDVAKHFHMESIVAALTPKEAASKYPSLKYYSDIFLTLLTKRMNGKKVKDGDYFDLEKIAYLDICDYIVTDDKAFLALFEESGIADLKGRAISLSTLIEHLGGKILENRPVSTVWKNSTKIRITTAE